MQIKAVTHRGVLALTLVATLAIPSLASAKPRVTLVTTKGTIVLELDKNKAPKSVANFVKYVKAGQYDGTIFHRVIPNFMIQGGGFDQQFKKKPTRAPIQNEADNGLQNRLGTIAMARTSAPHSASAQFFINVKNNAFLNHKSKTRRGWGYAVFGRVVKGLKHVMAIAHVKTGARGPFQVNAPLTSVVIKRACVGKCKGKK